MAVDLFARDAFLVEQLIRPMVNLYRVSTLHPDGRSPEQLVAFVRQKRMAIKEDLRAFADESETREVFRIKARRAIDIGGRYDVTDPAGARIGVLERRFGRSLFRSTWAILDEIEQERAWAQERSMAIAILRRLLGFVPYGDLIPIPYHFTFAVGERPIGGLRRLLGLRDRYLLDLSGDLDRGVDRRMAVALAIALDALQAR